EPVDAGAPCEHETRHVWRAAKARRVVELARSRFGESDELLRGFHGHAWMHGEQVRRIGYDGHEREILQHVEADLVEALAQREIAEIRQHQGVAIWHGPRNELGRDIAVCTRAVVSNDLLAPVGGDLGTDEPGQYVGRAAGRKWHDDAYGTVGIS